MHNFALSILYKNFTVDKLVTTSLVTILNSELILIKSKIRRFVFERKRSIPQKWLCLLVVIKVNLDQKITDFFSLYLAHLISVKQNFSIDQSVFSVLFLILKKVSLTWIAFIKKDLSVCSFATWERGKSFSGRSKNELKRNYENLRSVHLKISTKFWLSIGTFLLNQWLQTIFNATKCC